VAGGPAYHPARLLARADAGGGMTRVTVDPGEAVAATYGAPGQYVEVRTRGETGYFVLAGPPGAAPWELVMRPGGGASDVLLGDAPDADVEITAAIGEGFPVGELRGHPVVLALGGTGIAAGPPLVARRIADGDATRTRVFVGVRAADELPLLAELVAWRDAGVEVLVCAWQGDADAAAASWAPAGGGTVFRGYVQEAVAALVAPGSVRAVLAVGVGPMIEALRGHAPTLGIAPEHVLTNH
jgi:NAD(P)H-flavin reductase